MQIKPIQKISPKINLLTRQRIIVVAGFSVFTLVFFSAFFFNSLAPETEAIAAELASRYPFDVFGENLKKVSFAPLPLHINSNFEEVRPIISGNDQFLFFCRRNHPENINGVKDDQDIWISTRTTKDDWSRPENLGVKINTNKADAICSVKPDGTEIYLFTDEMDPSGVLFRSKKSTNGWSEPESVLIDDFYNNNPFIDMYYSYEANVLLLAVSRNDSKGEQDLYVSFPEGRNRFSKPQSLGFVVNSERSEFSPFLAADGKTLYFSSYGHEGFGGCDIFSTTRLDDTWQQWSKPVNLGEGINSEREESYFSISSNYETIYFESYDLKKVVRDIFKADLPDAAKPQFMMNDVPMARK
jgi:OOP family OmpA-OmpF porin